MSNSQFFPATAADIRATLQQPAPQVEFQPTEYCRLLQFRYDVMPPTSNHIYIRGTILTPEARDYGEAFSKWVNQGYGHLTQRMRKEGIYGIHIRFFFESVLNESFDNPKVPPSKRAKTRYKKMDLSNRVKLLEDCVRDAIGVDDCHTFAMSLEKHHCPQDPHVEVTVQEIDPSLFGL